MTTRSRLLTLLLLCLIACGCGKKKESGEGGSTAEESATGSDAGTASTEAATDAAPKPADGAPAAADPELEGRVDKHGADAVKFFEEMLAATEASGGDCKKLGEALKKLFDERGDALLKMKELEKDNTAAQELFEKKYGQRAQEVLTKMVPTLQKCQDDPGVIGAFQAME